MSGAVTGGISTALDGGSFGDIALDSFVGGVVGGVGGAAFEVASKALIKPITNGISKFVSDKGNSILNTISRKNASEVTGTELRELSSQVESGVLDLDNVMGSLKERIKGCLSSTAKAANQTASEAKNVLFTSGKNNKPIEMKLQFFAEDTANAAKKEVLDSVDNVVNEVIEGGSGVKLDTYKNMVNDQTVTGQAHHLSQDATFRDVIPKQEGLCIELNGNAFTEAGSQHYNAHNSLEGFWNNYRKGGDLYGEIPTVGEYNRALYNSLENAGISKPDSAYSVLEAFKQQRGYGLSNSDLVPRIPGRINQVQ